ncbi:PRC-barrel domain-containing protein [Methanoculleus chikugoensis]|uniref:PRC-barrel domain-containing protein n=1 Tax=Methanoculleus chikugoensis TaxID=118126 RepID=UPI0006CFB5BB|nr:PRC-barrel domain-containing protein [Methanoculleus chikugoensis]
MIAFEQGMVVAMAETILEQQVRRTEGQEFLSSEDVVGKRVKNPEGYDLGEISSLRVGLPTGRVAYAVLRTGGMFGLGAKHFAIPPIEAMVYRTGDDVFVANISKYRLDNEPGFSEGGLAERSELEPDRVETPPHGPPQARRRPGP